MTSEAIQPRHHHRAAVGYSIGALISRSLGVDPERVLRIQMDLTPGDLAIIKVTLAVSDVEEVLREYQLCEIERPAKQDPP